MPLPCTPTSTSELEDHSTSQPSTSTSTTDNSGPSDEEEEGSDLITPRPGPSDPDKRTSANLSTPLPATIASTSWSRRKEKVYYPTTSEDDGEEPEFPSKLPPGYQPPLRRVSITPGNPVVLDKGKGSLTASSLSKMTTQKTDVGQAASTETSADVAKPQKRASQSSSSDTSSRRPRARRNPSSIQTQRKRSPQEPPSSRISPKQSPRRQSPKHSPQQSTLEPSINSSSTSLGVAPERTRSITFSPASSLRPASDVAVNSVYTMMARRRDSPAISPSARHDLSDTNHDVESSADENTAIFRRANSGNKHVGSTLSYGTNNTTTASTIHPADDDIRFPGYEGAAEEEEVDDQITHPIPRVPSPLDSRRKGKAPKSKSSPNRGRRRRSSNDSTSSSSTSSNPTPHSSWSQWCRSQMDKYGSVELENKGSVARDHLALERTFLAWLRTSLSFASIGIAVTQLFRLNTSISSSSSSSPSSSSSSAGYSESTAGLFSPATNLRDPTWLSSHQLQTPSSSNQDFTKLRQIGKPLGATFLGISILVLLLGFHRYFESQHYVIRGKFPASRGSVVVVAVVSGALIVSSLVVVVVVAPAAFEK